MPLHMMPNTPPPKLGYFMVFIHPPGRTQRHIYDHFVISVVSICTSVTAKKQSHLTQRHIYDHFVISVVSICTTVTAKKQSHLDTTTPKTQANHGRQRSRPLPTRWWPDAHSGAMRVLITSPATLGTPGLIFLQGRVSSTILMISALYANFCQSGATMGTAFAGVCGCLLSIPAQLA